MAVNDYTTIGMSITWEYKMYLNVELVTAIFYYYSAINVQQFSTFSGLEINRMKSEAMWLGSNQNCTDTFF